MIRAGMGGTSDPRSTSDVTSLLHAWREGQPSALERLMPLVYDELRGIARRHLRSERPDHTLQPTALVHEAFLRLVNVRCVTWQDKAHFLAMASRVMRRVLVDGARARRSVKRGGTASRIALLDAPDVATDSAVDLMELDAALSALAVIDARKCQVVELRYFGGLEVTEVAAVLGVSTDTVSRDWNMAKAWLRRQLAKAGPSGP
jgi:RNA polymerase sigma factor (TIGR02999 family)